MLPIYIACCDAFVWVHHDQYHSRAWCLTEQFMFWKLNRSRVLGELIHTRLKLTLNVDRHTHASGKFCLTADGALEQRPAEERPRDPALGMLAVESDRVALATMTSILPYDESRSM